jgi:hypothetical protein
VSVQRIMYSETRDEGAIPQHLFEPTYQNRLRVLGRFIDAEMLHSITLIEIADGFILRAMRDTNPWPLLIEFDDRKTSKMLRRAPDDRGSQPPHRESRDLIPDGYENMLRALGFELDQRIAENIVITELPSFIAFSGFEPVLGYGEASFRPFSEPLAPPDIISMLRRAIERRGSYQHIQNYVPPNFRG